MSTTIAETFDRERMRAGLTAGAATVGRPTGVEGKNRTPRRAKMTSKEIDHIKTKAGIKAGGPGSGRHAEGNAVKSVGAKYGFRKWQSHPLSGQTHGSNSTGHTLHVNLNNGGWMHKDDEGDQMARGVGVKSLQDHFKSFRFDT